MAGGKGADVEGDAGKAGGLHLLPLGNEAIGNAALVEHFDGAGMEAPGAGAGQALIGAALDNGDIDAGEGQFARQHQPDGAAAGNDHGMFGFAHLSLRNFWLGRCFTG
ncbi:hypothetical protein FQZ97_1256260 [compost metagenome]